MKFKLCIKIIFYGIIIRKRRGVLHVETFMDKYTDCIHYPHLIQFKPTFMGRKKIKKKGSAWIFFIEVR